ncbi:MAG: DUF4129 domain-containing protein [Gemmatimonadaceae bacterium]
MLQPAPAAVRDTLAAVFRQPAFERSLRDTLWRRFTRWLGDMIERLGTFTGESPALAWTLRVVIVLAIALVVARLTYVLWARRPARAGGNGRRAGSATADDPWRRARAEADAGRHTEAAHLLYAGLLQWLAATERLKLHPSKTAGDYSRELRARSSGALGGFRDFARSYETVVYGDQRCDRECYERLDMLAGRLARPRG